LVRASWYRSEMMPPSTHEGPCHTVSSIAHHTDILSLHPQPKLLNSRESLLLLTLPATRASPESERLPFASPDARPVGRPRALADSADQSYQLACCIVAGPPLERPHYTVRRALRVPHLLELPSKLLTSAPLLCTTILWGGLTRISSRLPLIIFESNHKPKS
jgi:hypothetical protein